MRLSNEDVLLRWPLTQHIITAGWLYNDGSLHRALDFRAEVGTPVYAAEGGTVEVAYHWNGKRTQGDTNSYGNMVKLKHATYKYGALETLYAHLNKIVVKQGQQVKEGQLIGYSGDTGNCYGAHLHFEVRWKGQRTNPLNWLDNDFTTASGQVFTYRPGEHAVEKPAETPSTSPAAEEGKTIQAMLIGPLTAAEAAAFDAMAVESGLADDRYVKLAVDAEGKMFMRAATLTGMDAMRMYALAQNKGLKYKYFSKYVG